MTRKIMAWRIVDLETVEKLVHVRPDYERHLENWITQDPSIISEDLILIGRQRQTRFGTIVDLIGVNRHGDLVLIELKRNKTSREMIAQALEYATWASGLSYKEVIEIADDYLGSEDALEEAFYEKFGQELPDTLNQAQQIVLVALSIKESTAAVVEYLSDNFGVAINAIGLSMVEVDGAKVLLRDAVIEQDESTPPATRKRAKKPTVEELLEKAKDAGNADLADYFWSIRETFKSVETLTWSWSFHATGSKSNRVVMSVFPFGTKHARNEVGNKFVISVMPDSLADVYGKTIEDCTKFIAKCQRKYGQAIPAPKKRKLRFAIDDLQQGKLFFAEFCQFFGVQQVDEEN